MLLIDKKSSASGGATEAKQDTIITALAAINGNTAGATAAVTSNASVTTSNSTVLAANTSRKGAAFYNDSADRVYLKFGATASTTDFTVALDQDDVLVLENGDYSGIVDGITASGTSNVKVTEAT